jgi:hypothetical protein
MFSQSINESVLILLLLALAGTIIALLVYLQFRSRGRTGAWTLYELDKMPPLPKALMPLDMLLIAEGYRRIGAARYTLTFTRGRTTPYYYLSASGDTYASLMRGFGLSTLSLSSRFEDGSLLHTSYPFSSPAKHPMLRLAYARRDPQAALKYHPSAAAEWSQEKGVPDMFESLQDVYEAEQWAGSTYSRTLSYHFRRLGVATLFRYLSVMVTCAATLLTDPSSIIWALLAILGSSGYFTLVYDPIAMRYLRQPRGALDDERLAKRLWGEAAVDTARVDREVTNRKLPKEQFSMRLRRWTLRLAEISLVLSVLVINLTIAYSTTLSIQSLNNGQWMRIPITDFTLRDLEALPDDTLWSIDTERIARWDGDVWHSVHTLPDRDSGIDLELDGATLWALTNENVIRCDTAALACETEYKLPGAAQIAARDGRVLAISASGSIASYDGAVWQEFSAQDDLPGSTLDRADYAWQTNVVITSDGASWVKWNQVWRSAPGENTWQPIMLNFTDEQPIFYLIGTAPNSIWTHWGHELSPIQNDLNTWQVYSREEIGIDLNRQTLDMDVDSQGVVWIAARQGLVRYDEGAFTLIPAEDGAGVRKVFISPSDQVWTFTQSDSRDLLIVAVLPVVLYIIVRVVMKLRRP